MKLSIVVAVYNTSKYLRQCLDSLFNQSLPLQDYEVIVVNDKSTDNSIEIINEYAAKYSNMKVIDKEVNEATFWSRVDGIAASSGDYVGFVDSDDWMHEDMYATMIDKGEKSGADIVECGTIYMYEDGTVKQEDIRSDRLYKAEEVMKHYSENPTQVALYIRIISRKVIKGFMDTMYPYFNERRSEYCGIRNEDDLLWPLMISLADNILNIEERFCYHRMDAAGSTMDIIRKNPGKFVDAAIFRTKAGFDVMNLMGHKETMLKYIEHKQINVIFGMLGRLLESNYYDKEKSKILIEEAVSKFSKEKKATTYKDTLRFWHLCLKAKWCYGRR